MNTVSVLILVGVTCIGCASRRAADTDQIAVAIAYPPGGIASITEGMTALQVQSILGPPGCTSGKGPVVYWYYHVGRRDYFVLLVRDRVEFIGERKTNEQGLFPL